MTQDDPQPTDAAGTASVASRLQLSHVDLLFTGLLFVFFAVLLARTPDYDPLARIFPYVVGTAALGLLSILFAVQLSSAARAAFQRIRTDDIDDLFGLYRSQTRADPERAKRFVIILVLIALAHVSIVSLGFVVGPLLFLTIYYVFVADVSLVRAIAITAVVWLSFVGMISILGI